MFNIIEGIPFMIGGMMINSAMYLCNRSPKGAEAGVGSSLYNFLSVDFGTRWKSSFIAGMTFLACLTASIFGFGESESAHIKPFESTKLFFAGNGLMQCMVSGFLIGLGLKLASGGLNNFALYGLPRFNSPSFIATAITLVFAIFTATLRSIFPILQGLNIGKKFNEHLDFRLSMLIPLIILGFNLVKNYGDRNSLKEIMKSFGIGAFLAAGMLMSGLARRHQMLHFLGLTGKWNPFLLFVLFGAFLSNFLMSRIFGRQFTPTLEGASTKSITPKAFIGCALFGIGLGMDGLTPGAGLLVSAIYLPQVILFFLPFIGLGQMAGGFLERFGAPREKVVKTQ